MIVTVFEWCLRFRDDRTAKAKLKMENKSLNSDFTLFSHIKAFTSRFDPKRLRLLLEKPTSRYSNFSKSRPFVILTPSNLLFLP